MSLHSYPRGILIKVSNLKFSRLGCVGELVIPAVVAAYIDQTPRVFLWVILVYSIGSLFGVLLLMGIQYILLRKQRLAETHGFELRNANDGVYSISYNAQELNNNNHDKVDVKHRKNH